MTFVAEQTAASERLTACYLESLTVEGVRCFGPRQTLLLRSDGRPAKWTIVLGENGSGKTTLLQCAWAMVPCIPRPEPGALAGSYPRGYPAFRIGLARSPASDMRIACEVATNELLSSVAAAWIRQSSTIESSGGTQTAQPYSGLNALCCAYGALRRSSEASVEKRWSIHEAPSLFLDDAPLTSASEWFLRADYAAKSTENPRASARRDGVRAALIGGLLPEVTDLRLVGLDEEPLRPHIEVHTPYGWVPMRALGLGYRTMIAWVVDLASRMFEAHPQSTNPLAEPAIALVDEIDLHLHPRWQRELIPHLDRLFPNVQFIATAHSPLVVQSEGVDNVAVLRRVGDHVEILNDPEEVRGWRVDQILTSDLFGLASARSPAVERLFERQRDLVTRDTLTTEEREELRRIDEEIDALAPTGETAADRTTWGRLHELSARLRASDGT